MIRGLVWVGLLGQALGGPLVVPAQDVHVELFSATAVNVSWSSPGTDIVFSVDLFDGAANANVSEFRSIVRDVQQTFAIVEGLVQHQLYTARVGARRSQAAAQTPEEAHEQVLTSKLFFFSNSVPASPPASGQVIQMSSNRLVIRWNDVPDATRFRVIEKSQVSVHGTQVKASGDVLGDDIEDTTFMLGGLVASTLYTFTVIPGNLAGYATSGIDITGLTLTQVTQLTVDTVTENSATISWNPSPGSNEFQIRGTLSDEPVVFANVTSNIYTLRGLNETTPYTIRVHAGVNSSFEDIGEVIVVTPKSKLRRATLGDKFDSPQLDLNRWVWSHEPLSWDVNETVVGSLSFVPKINTELFSFDTANRLYQVWPFNFDVTTRLHIPLNGSFDCVDAGLAIVSPTTQAVVNTQHGRINEFASVPQVTPPKCFQTSFDDALLHYPRTFLSECFPTIGRWIVLKVRTRGTASTSSMSFHKRDDDTTAGLVRSVSAFPSSITNQAISVFLRIRREGRVFTAWWRQSTSEGWKRIGQTPEMFTGRIEVGLFAAACHNNIAAQIPRVVFDFFGDPEQTQENQEASCRTSCLNLPVGELADNAFRLRSSAKYLHTCNC